MLSGWHLARLPVYLKGQRRAIQTIEKVVVSWPELAVAGFVLRPRPFFVPFVSARTRCEITGTGLWLESVESIERRTRAWRREAFRIAALYENAPVYDTANGLLGHLQDIAIDAAGSQVTHLVVTRGVLGDLLHGALIVPRTLVVSAAPGKVKIYAPREPLLVK